MLIEEKSFWDVCVIVVGYVKLGKFLFKLEGLVFNWSLFFFFSLFLFEIVWKEIWI